MKIKEVVLIALISSVSLSCASYTCGDIPEAGCQPVSEIYSRTNKGSKANKAKTDGSEVGADTKQTANAMNYANPGDPLLSKPKIIRILITQWEDSDKDLHSGGYVFVKVKDAEWTVKNQ